MFRSGAIRRPPGWAVIDEDTLAGIEERLDIEGMDLQSLLDAGYAEIDREQPILSAWVADRVAACHDELAQSLGYFLVITVFLAFKDAAGSRLKQVDEEKIAFAEVLLETDEELRADDPLEVLESDDIIAIGQPALVEYIQHHMTEAVGQAEGEPPVEEFDYVYRTLLIEVIALTESIAPPPGSTNEDSN